ncbi:hypothetical protein, partial [Rhizobium sp. NLR22b]|uniref:hypothetical protein n=1 Tax=Rhizobium sp. NLR22b TaxID=2731115 RepID=UPI001C82E5AF
SNILEIDRRSSKLKCEKVRIKPWLPKSRQLSAFVAVRDRMCPATGDFWRNRHYGTTAFASRTKGLRRQSLRRAQRNSAGFIRQGR